MYCIPYAFRRKPKDGFFNPRKEKCRIQEWGSRLRGQEESVSLRDWGLRSHWIKSENFASRAYNIENVLLMSLYREFGKICD